MKKHAKENRNEKKARIEKERRKDRAKEDACKREKDFNGTISIESGNAKLNAGEMILNIQPTASFLIRRNTDSDAIVIHKGPVQTHRRNLNIIFYFFFYGCPRGILCEIRFGRIRKFKINVNILIIWGLMTILL